MNRKKSIQRTGYVSEIDAFFHALDKKRTQFPPSREQEIAKHKKIAAKRDGIVPEQTDFIWKGF